MRQRPLTEKEHNRVLLLKARGELGVPIELANALRGVADKEGLSPLRFATTFQKSGRKFFKGKDDKEFARLTWLTLLTLFGDDYALRPVVPSPTDAGSCPYCTQTGQKPDLALQANGDVVASYRCYDHHCDRRWEDRYVYAGRTFE